MKILPLSKPCERAIKRAISIARTLGSDVLLPEHFFGAMLYGKNSVTRYFKSRGISIAKVRSAWHAEFPEAAVTRSEKVECATGEWKIAMQRAQDNAQRSQCNSVNVFHVFAAAIDLGGIATEIMKIFEITKQAIYEFLATFAKKAGRYLLGIGIAEPALA